MLKRLTPPFLDNVKPPKAGRDDYTDMGQEGLILRVSHIGKKHWSVVYRITGQGGFNPKTGRELKGPQQRLSIGQYPQIGLKDARDKAERIRTLADAGKDPKELRIAEVHAKQAAAADATMAAEREDEERRRNSVAAIAEELLAVARVELRRPRNLEGTLKKHILPNFGEQLLSDITHVEINKLLTTYKTEGAFGTAREVKKHISKLMTFGLQHGYIDRNPMSGVLTLPKGDPNKEKKERVLSTNHLKALWNHAGSVGYPYGTLVQLVILTGCRVHEMEQATWDEIDFEERALVLGPQRSKIKDTVMIPFTDRAWALIESLPRFNQGNFMFSTSGGTKPVNSRTYMLKLMNDGLPENMREWSMHDLRHSYRTKLAQLGVRSDIAERCLGHKVQGIEGVYNHHHYLGEKREASELYSDFVGRLHD